MSKFNIEPNVGIFDVSLENDCASPNVKTPVPLGARPWPLFAPPPTLDPPHGIVGRCMTSLHQVRVLNLHRCSGEVRCFRHPSDLRPVTHTERVRFAQQTEHVLRKPEVPRIKASGHVRTPGGDIVGLSLLRRDTAAETLLRSAGSVWYFSRLRCESAS